MRIGASTVLLEKAPPLDLMQAARDFGATVMFTAPTSYRAIAILVNQAEVAAAALLP
jgi:2-aminobenzoate-CoA ligase